MLLFEVLCLEVMTPRSHVWIDGCIDIDLEEHLTDLLWTDVEEFIVCFLNSTHGAP